MCIRDRYQRRVRGSKGDSKMLLVKVLHGKGNPALRLLRKMCIQEGSLKNFRKGSKFEQPSAKRDRMESETKKRKNREQTGARIRWLLWNIKGGDQQVSEKDEPMLVDMSKLKR
eukprot:TRINITY_DN19093_c0_g1_i1.p1 TRINITY_DN19093_c0_g1~~TRINITY_DN19093_c0_g1_i1.p1  ORF type:complete len:114 (-),score=34.63 TRINITY_DN19093_c0_g1_i1:316-657(-)